MKNFAMLLVALPALLGTASAAPVRHLEYAFAAYSTVKPTGGLYDGTLGIDVLGPAPDGGALVRTTEHWAFMQGPLQSQDCEIYATSAVRCDVAPPVTSYQSSIELALLPLFARDFFSGASAAQSSSWKRNFELAVQNAAYADQVYLTDEAIDLTATPQSDSRDLVVSSKGVFQQLDELHQEALEAGTFVYDRVAGLPLKVHEVHTPIGTSSIYTETAVDLLLLKDSASPGLQQPQPNYELSRPHNRIPIPLQ